MLQSLLRGEIADFLLNLLYTLPAVFIALTVHECAHGFIAYKLGDPTAKMTGRLSINPIDHIDPLGFICLLFFGFGWAKPVMVNYSNLKKPLRDAALVSVAGPISNFLCAFVFTLFYYLCVCLLPMAGWSYGLVTVLLYVVIINVGLGLFNLLPCPPLDGSKILYAFLPHKGRLFFDRNQHYLNMALIFVILLGSWTSVDLLGFLDVISSWIIDLYITIAQKVLFFL
jgi:Zn-dependent protease